MEAISLLIAVVALVVAILAYQRTGGIADLKRRLSPTTSSVDLQKQIDALVELTGSLRDKIADALDRLEKLIRKTEKSE